MKFLNGKELADFIKERHAKQVRSLKANKVSPKLAIVQAKDDPVIDTYVRLKKKYGSDIGIEVEVHKPKQPETAVLIDKLNKDESVTGIIVQLPLPEPTQTDELVNMVKPEKDVDALGANAIYQPATPMAILWLLAGYNVELLGKKVLLIGKGKLVGAPLEKILKDSRVNVIAVDKSVSKERLAKIASESEVIITAANTPEILNASMIMSGAIIVDAGTAEESGKIKGNVCEDVYERDDITITPRKGGVGPLTVCALFENVIRAAQDKVQTTEKRS